MSGSFARHVRRKFNGECDEIAGRGKKINDTKMFVDTFESDVKYWKGAWDGGYDPGSVFVGLGFKVWTTNEDKFIDETVVPCDWKVKAFQCLVITIQALVMNTNIPIDECLGIPTCQCVLPCSTAALSLEKNMTIYLKRKIEKEKELWDKPTKLVNIAINSSLHEGSGGDWHEPPCKTIKSQQQQLFSEIAFVQIE